jgi:lipid-A-disaccharide synthase
MADRLNLFLLAGEPSGDRIGADLVRRLRDRVDLSLTGIGGDELEGQGMQSLFPMSELAVMGISDVLRRLPKLLWRVRQVADAILEASPDVTVLIDSQEFSRLVAKRLNERGFRRPLLLYVAPSVWARAPQRAAKLKPLFDEVLSVLPFEPAVLHRLGGPPASYVGHPAIFEANLSPAVRDRRRVALLPGSRVGEIHRHLDLMRDVARKLGSNRRVAGIYMPTLPSLVGMLTERVEGWGVPVEIVSDRSRRRDLYAETLLAVSVAGTATLELAIAGVPTILTYVMDGHQARVYRKLGRPKVGLPNIILDREVIPEFVQSRPDPTPLVEAVERLLDDNAERGRQLEAFSELRARMSNGDEGAPRQDPADRVLAHWRRYQRALGSG